MFKVTEAFPEKEPFYLPISNEVELFEAAYRAKIPVILKGPTGCGKTRFIEYMAFKLKRPFMKIEEQSPLITVSCHEDLTASDLVGRYLIEGGETVWVDGPLTRAVKSGAICYLDEIVEARKETTVVIHPLSDHRRILPIEKRGEVIKADDGFLLVMSYNPGYQSVAKDLKQSTRQRFIAIDFEHPKKEVEAKIIAHEAQIDEGLAFELARVGEKVRNIKGKGIEEGVSTRLLIYCAKLIKEGIDKLLACEVAIANPITDDVSVKKGIMEIAAAILG